MQLWLRMLKEDTNSPFRDCARMGDLWTIKVQNALINVEQHVLRLLDNSLILSNCFYHTLQPSKHAVKRFPGDTFRQQALEQSTEMCERIQRRMTLEKVISGSERETKSASVMPSTLVMSCRFHIHGSRRPCSSVRRLSCMKPRGQCARNLTVYAKLIGAPWVAQETRISRESSR